MTLHREKTICTTCHWFNDLYRWVCFKPLNLIDLPATHYKLHMFVKWEIWSRSHWNSNYTNIIPTLQQASLFKHHTNKNKIRTVTNKKKEKWFNNTEHNEQRQGKRTEEEDLSVVTASRSNCTDQERKRHEEEYNRTLLSSRLSTDVN